MHFQDNDLKVETMDSPIESKHTCPLRETMQRESPALATRRVSPWIRATTAVQPAAGPRYFEFDRTCTETTRGAVPLEHRHRHQYIAGMTQVSLDKKMTLRGFAGKENVGLRSMFTGLRRNLKTPCKCY
jgi:hypothetical protein